MLRGARLFYERAADAGLAQAAMSLAATFDADELAKLQVRGIQADAKEARRWYERARQLGAAEAEQRLRRLGANEARVDAQRRLKNSSIAPQKRRHTRRDYGGGGDASGRVAMLCKLRRPSAFDRLREAYAVHPPTGCGRLRHGISR